MPTRMVHVPYYAHFNFFLYLPFSLSMQHNVVLLGVTSCREWHSINRRDSTDDDLVASAVSYTVTRVDAIKTSMTTH